MNQQYARIAIIGLFVFSFSLLRSQNTIPATLRAPAYPLVTVDPYTSAWSFSDKLYEDVVRHWTGKPQALTGAIRVDGTAYRFMGKVEPVLKTLIHTAAAKAWSGKYTFDKPADTWFTGGFDDAPWSEGKAAFGTKDMPFLRTPWETKDIWVRRAITLTQDATNLDLYIEYSHDDNFELYFNGVKIVDTGYAWKNNVRIPLSEEAKKTIKNGENIIAAHGHNVTGGAYVDFGLFERIPGQDYLEKTAIQRSVTVTPTQTHYQFDCGAVVLNLTFTSPLLANDLNLLSRPVNYVSYEVTSKDGKPHPVEIYFEASSDWAVDSPQQEVTAAQSTSSGLTFLKTGTKEQNVLGRKGDDVRIDWGYFYLTGNASAATAFATGDHTLRKEFVQTGTLSKRTAASSSADAEHSVLLAYVHSLGNVSAKATSGKIMLGSPTCSG